MKKHYVLLAGALLAATAQTQAQTKIGGPGAADSSAMLEVTGGAGNNKGILLPRISLINVDNWGLSGSTPVAGMYVYNTNAGIFGGDGTGPYYWNGTKWVKALDSFGWRINGNSGTDSSFHFIGTLDARPMSIRTNNAVRMKITELGDVGIGTATPAARLHVAGSNQVNMTVENTNGTIDNDLSSINARINTAAAAPVITQMYSQSFAAQPNGGLGVVRTSTPHDLALGAAGVERMRITTTGNVGVGTSTPTAMLDVNGTARIAGNAGNPASLIMGRDANGYVSNISLGANLSLAGGVLSASGGGGGTTDWTLGGNTGTDPSFNYVGTGDAQPLVFRTNGAEHLRITTDGKIGIDNAAPIASLDINGSARITTSIGTATALTGRDANGYLSNIALGANLSLAGGVLSATGGGTAGWGLTGNAGTNPAANFIGTTDAQPLALSTNGTEKVRIGTNGFMGIGTNAPNSRLHIVSDGLGTGSTDDILLASYGPAAGSVLPTFFFQAATGTAASPGNTADNTQMGSMRFNAVVGGSVSTQSGIASNYTGNGNTNGANLTFMTSQGAGAFIQRMIIEPAGNVGIGIANPAYALDVTGDINASNNVRAGGVVLTSDARLKRNISHTQHGLSTVMALNPVEYEKKSSIKAHDYNRHEIGFIAQEIQKVLPSVVTEGKDADKTLAVAYTELIPVLTKAIQELNTQVETLKAKNEALEASNKVTAQLVERVKQMEQMIGIKEIEGSSKVAGK